MVPIRAAAMPAVLYQSGLGTEMEQHYHMGNLNGSLFATEGVASVGAALAPLSALACGFLLSNGLLLLFALWYVTPAVSDDKGAI